MIYELEHYSVSGMSTGTLCSSLSLLLLCSPPIVLCSVKKCHPAGWKGERKKRKPIASLYLCAFRRFLSSAPLSVNRYLENIHMMLLGSGWRRSGRISVQSKAKKNVSLRTKALSVWQIKKSYLWKWLLRILFTPSGLFRRILLILGQSSSHFCTCHSS